MVAVKILGTGCPRCERLELLVGKAIRQLGLHVTVEKVTDINEIISYQSLSVPTLMINERVVAAGRVPDIGEIVPWLEAAADEPAEEVSQAHS